MKKNQIVIAVMLVGIMGSNAPLSTYGASPEFARTEEEWTILRDDILTYDEIPLLIEEYNVTALNSYEDYQDFLEEYGETNTEVSQAYQDLANDLESSISGDDSASAKISDLQIELQVETMRENADNNLEDSEILWMGTLQARDNLALSAQSRFIGYHEKIIQLEMQNLTLQQLQSNLTLVQARLQAGMATEIDVLNATEAVLEQQKNINTLAMDIEEAKDELILMLGWNVQDSPQIQQVPQVTEEQIEDLNLEQDIMVALENNYVLNQNEKRFENANEQDVKDLTLRTIEENKKQIESSMTVAWQNLETARLVYEQAVLDLEAQERTMELATQQYNVGTITKYDLEKETIELKIKQNTVLLEQMNIFEAYEIYSWYLDGLAPA